jgi:hypothetical protein
MGQPSRARLCLITVQQAEHISFVTEIGVEE